MLKKLNINTVGKLKVLNAAVLIVFLCIIFPCSLYFFDFHSAIKTDQSVMTDYYDKQYILNSISSDIFQIQFSLIQIVNEYNFGGPANESMESNWSRIKERDTSIGDSVRQYSVNRLNNTEKEDLDEFEGLVENFITSQENMKKLIDNGKEDTTSAIFAYTDTLLVVQEMNYSLKYLERDWIFSRNDQERAQAVKENEQTRKNDNIESIVRGSISILCLLLLTFEFRMMDAISKAAKREKTQSWPADI